MTVLEELRDAVSQVGVALRRPEAFTTRFRDRALEGPPNRFLVPVLLGNAVLGLAAYGLTIGFPEGASGMLAAAAKAPIAAGLAWTLALPALYILGSALGSRLDAPTTFLAALTTVSFGALAMLASVPVSWFFALALPYEAIRLAVHATVFAGVGVCMVDVFLRTMKALEPERGRFFALVWLALVGVIGGELMLLFDLFRI